MTDGSPTSNFNGQWPLGYDNKVSGTTFKTAKCKL